MHYHKITNKEKRRRAFNRQKGKCYHCQNPMILRDRKDGGRTLPNEATLEHLDDRYSQHRGNRPGQIRVVAACAKCNHKRAAKRTAERPIEELWWRSGRPPGDQT